MEEKNPMLRKTCRICAASFSNRLLPLFREENMMLMQFIYNDEYYIKVTKNDGLPQSICSGCKEEFLKIKIFLKKCKEAQKILLRKFKEATSLNLSKSKPIGDLKIEYDNSDNDEIYYYNSDSLENGCSEIKTTELIIEKYNPLEIELKIENEITEEKSLKETIKTENKCEKSSKNEDTFENINDTLDNNVTLTKYKRDTRSNLKKNSDNLKGNQYKCSICNEKFKNITDLKHHKRSHQKQKYNKRKTFLCDLCGKEFVKQDSLKDHMNTHIGIKPYKCEMCEKAFTVRNALRAHVLKHSKNESYTCEICAKVFTTKGYYREHSKRHIKGVLLENNEKPFKCPHCPRSFKLLSTLTAHCNFHNKTSDRKYQCTECNTTFKRSDHLKEHINGVHLNIKPFKCDICPKTFVTGAIRNAHVKKFHSGKRYKCNLCEKDFSLSTSLSRHKRTHNGDKRFICEICNMSFMAVYQIEKHMETHKIDENMKNSLISQTYEEINRTVLDVNQK